MWSTTIFLMSTLDCMEKRKLIRLKYGKCMDELASDGKQKTKEHQKWQKRKKKIGEIKNQ